MQGTVRPQYLHSCVITNIMIVVNCPALSLDNGQVSYSTVPATNGGYSENTTATFLCNHAYNLSRGTNSTTCEVSGNWDQESPTCDPGKT